MGVIAFASGSGGAMFVPEKIEHTMPRVKISKSNDNIAKDIANKEDKE